MTSKPKQEVRKGAQVGGIISILYISSTIIQYYCHECSEQLSLPYAEEDTQFDWFKFQCEKCDAKRVIQLREFVQK